jgi:hypothetical protein
MRAILLILAASLPACRQAKPPAPNATAPHVKYAITHADGKPCPAGYVLRTQFFTERDGTHEDACSTAHGVAAEFTLDELRSGESIVLTLPVMPKAAPGRPWAVSQ